jgi:TonB family protein
MGASGAVAGGGGAPFRYDNPTAGISTPTGSLSFDTKGFDWGSYSRRIYWIIWSNWNARMPQAVYTGQKGAVTVRFVIERDGRLSVISILDESGVPAYDSAAVLALEASNPLPPLPDNFPKEREGVTGRFLYNMYR